MTSTPLVEYSVDAVIVYRLDKLSCSVKDTIELIEFL